MLFKFVKKYLGSIVSHKDFHFGTQNLVPTLPTLPLSAGKKVKKAVEGTKATTIIKAARATII